MIPSNSKGATILEIVITILLLAVAVPALVQLYSHAIIDTSTTDVQARAIFLAQQKMEEIFSDKWAPTRGYTYVVTAGRYPSETLTGGFVRTVTVDTAGLSLGGTRYALVQVHVTHDLSGAVEVSSWIARY
jgi:Tfp pilus assembly protein PilV